MELGRFSGAVAIALDKSKNVFLSCPPLAREEYVPPSNSLSSTKNGPAQAVVFHVFGYVSARRPVMFLQYGIIGRA